MERAKVKRGSGKGVERSFLRWLSRLLRVVLVAVMLGQTAVAQAPKADPFPSLAELEQMLAEAPDLRAVEVEMERQRMEGSWGNRVFVYANHSQSFSSFVPFIPLDDFGVAGGTTVGVSVSVTLDRLLGKPTPADLDQRLKVLEYEMLFQEKLVTLQRSFGKEKSSFPSWNTSRCKGALLICSWRKCRSDCQTGREWWRGDAPHTKGTGT